MSNRGVYPPITDGGPEGPCAGFDAYSATIFANADGIYEELFVLLDSAGFEPVKADGGKVRFYAQNRVIIDAKGHQLLALKSGGSNPHPHMECTGRAARTVAQHLRGHFRHRPTRIDHAIDVASQEFDHLHAFAKGLCKQYGLKLGYGGDWSTADVGRTVYIGSRKSQVFVRIYEKGLEYAQKLGLPVTDELRRWLRIEVEFKPQTDAAKKLAPSIEGPQLWGSAIWTAEVAKRVSSMVTEPVCIRERRESDRERALRFMVAQYGKHLSALCEELGGDWAEVGRWIGERAASAHEGAQEAA